ncbi:MAG: type II toxin-antitoxin system death-on-curing family toxin [Candidatus Sericytochromatia bacterium]
MSQDLCFLSREQVLRLHRQSIERYGGSDGLRDEGLLDAALSMPSAGFGDSYFHVSLFDKAAAYLYHVVKNHPFVDGNKRTGFACADVFLRLNGYRLKKAVSKELYQLVLQIAAGEDLSKSEIALALEQFSEAWKPSL